MISMIAGLAIFTACNKDESFDAPAVTAPAATSAGIASDIELTFNFTTDGGFKSSSVTATNGTAGVKTDGTSGSKSGAIFVTYTAGSVVSAGFRKLTVTDNENKTSSGTGVISVLEEQIEFTVSGNITQNTTWETGKVYILTSRIAVVSGVTLTIQEGVVVKCEAGTGANATALLIARGGKLMAEGTADAPIIFTSVADEIMPGEVASPNLEPTLNGLWGGLLILETHQYQLMQLQFRLKVFPHQIRMDSTVGAMPPIIQEQSVTFQSAMVAPILVKATKSMVLPLEELDLVRSSKMWKLLPTRTMVSNGSVELFL